MADPDVNPSRPSTPNQQSRSIERDELLRTPTKQTGAHHSDFGSHGTPVSRTEDNCRESYPDSSANARYERFSDEMQDWFIGPVSSESFIELCFPESSITDHEMPEASGAFQEIDLNEKDEKKLYTILVSVRVTTYRRLLLPTLIDLIQIDAINGVERCPRFFLADTSDTVHHSGRGSMKPDLCLYSDKAPIVKIMKDASTGKYFSHFGFVEIFIEIKIDPKKNDPFSNFVQALVVTEESEPDDSSSGSEQPKHEFLKDDDSKNTASRNRGQIVAYASEICARQHRTHCFSVSVYGSTARLFRWDRAGVIISDLIDLHKNPEILCQFLWRYSQATDPQRGYDTSVKKTTTDEERIFKQVITEHIKEQLCPTSDQIKRLLFEHYEPDAVFKIPIHPSQVTYEPKEERLEDSMSSEPGEKALKPWDALWDEEMKKERDEALSLERPIGLEILSPSSAETEQSKRTNFPDSSSRCRGYTKPQQFLVSVPITTPLTNTGYGTREYWAVKVPDESVGETDYGIAFLKDTWRVVTDGIEIEGEMMVELYESNVKFVSDVYCYGDVVDESKVEGEGTLESSSQDVQNDTCKPSFSLIKLIGYI